MASADISETSTGRSQWGRAASAWSPAVDVYETPDACAVTAEVAGAEDLHIELAGDRRTLSLRGRRTCRPAPLAHLNAGGPGGPGSSGRSAARIVCHQLEIATGPFERLVTLPCAVDAAGASARCDGGLLYVVLPKARVRGPVRVHVTSGGAARTTLTTGGKE